MKILLFGASGFVGTAVYKQLINSHEVFAASSKKSEGDHAKLVDLTDITSIVSVIEWAKPDVVVSCAGIVENSEKANLNVVFTRNILDAILKTKNSIQKIVISGSAAEYGNVENSKVAINENAPLKPSSIYGSSKVEETTLALAFGKDHKIKVVIARIFNPIGIGMNQKFLVPSIIQQIEKINNGEAKDISLSRKDSVRDYVNIKDIASAIEAIVENPASNGVYNIGSGVGTSNGKLTELLVESCKLSQIPRIIETVNEPEKPVASIADISKISNELGWSPSYSIEKTVEEIIHA